MEKKMPNNRGISPMHPKVYQPCLHLHNKLIRMAKICIRNYECRHCFFDQWLEETEEISRNGKRIKITRDNLVNVA